MQAETELERTLCGMDGAEMLREDPWLEPYANELRNRWADFRYWLGRVRGDFGGLLRLSDYRDWGLFIEFEGRPYTLSQYHSLWAERSSLRKNAGKFFLVYREWAPNADYLSLVGDFNRWDKHACPGEADGFGVWTVRMPFVIDANEVYSSPIPHDGRYKVFVHARAMPGVQGPTGCAGDLFRMPQRTLYAVHNHVRGMLEPSMFLPEETFVFRHPKPLAPGAATLRIYEAHVGMASEGERIATYREFADRILPRIAEKGYNCVQLMAIQEHSFYASFGYQVTGFFAPSSRFGTPNDLKYLVDTAHSLGIVTLLDLVHSHASKNVEDGVAAWDGTQFMFLQEDHPLWDSKVFDYKNPETLRFLLQNVRWWLEEFNFDGFRFDGVMSLMYWHRSAGVGYTGRYGEYFDADSRVDVGGLTYLRLAHALMQEMGAQERLRQLGEGGAAPASPSSPPSPSPAPNPTLLRAMQRGMVAGKTSPRFGADVYLTIAEDVSGYPGLATPLTAGGVGFGYRFQMAVPDLWQTMMKKGFDMGLNDMENVEIGKIRFALVNRRARERHIVYAECHDQSLVGDKTLSMWLLNENIYDQMSILSQPNDRVLRAIRIHKLIRLVTIGLGGEGYLAFMGNEFGHPQWVDFPRPANGWSYHHCRRLWNLDYWGRDGATVRYSDWSRFDKELMALNARYDWGRYREWITREDELEKIICWERPYAGGVEVGAKGAAGMASLAGGAALADQNQKKGSQGEAQACSGALGAPEAAGASAASEAGSADPSNPRTPPDPAGTLLFVCSFHPFNPDYELIVPLKTPGTYEVVFRTNEERFGGDGWGTAPRDRMTSRSVDEPDCGLQDWEIREKMNGLRHFIRVWIKHQCGYVLRRVK